MQQAQLQKLSSDIENKILTGGALSAEDVRRAQAIGIRDKQLLKYADELRKYIQVKNVNRDNNIS
jgi:hypothetical protein